MSSLIDRMKARMTGSVTKPAAQPEVERTRHLIKTNRWDDRAWDVTKKTDAVTDIVTDLSLGDEHQGGERSEFTAADELTEGLFQTFFKAAPELQPRRAVDREVYGARKILEELHNHPQLAELQEITAGDSLMSMVAVEAMHQTVREIVGRMPAPPPPKQPKGPKQPGGQPGGGPGGEPGGAGGDQPGGEPGGGSGGGNAAGDDDKGQQGDGSEEEDDLTEDADTEDFDADSEDAENQAEAEWEAEYDAMLGDLDLDRVANKALEQANKETSDLEGLRKGIGLGDGEWKSMAPEARLAFAEKMRTQEMKELADVIGRMKRFALGIKATKVNDVPHEAYDVEVGNDIRRVLRAEFAFLATPETSYEFYRKYADKELLQYKMRGHEEVGKGPIVIAIDKSGSMSGQPFMWAMAVAEALRRFASDEERDYYAMFFGNNNDRERFDFPKGTGPFEKVLAFLGTQANGGTEFDGVLTEALEKASKSFDGEGKGKADVVFITDGQAHLSDGWIANFNKERERTGVRVYSVFIGGGYDMRYQEGPLGLLGKISDVTIPVSELKPESAEAIFAKI